MNRRDFLKSAIVVAAGLLLGVRPEMADVQEEAESKELAFGNMTFGNFPQRHILGDGEWHTYVADIGWLRDSYTNNVYLSSDAKGTALEKLNGAPIFDRSTYHNEQTCVIGWASVVNGTIICQSSVDLSGLRPALQIAAIARDIKKEPSKETLCFVEKVKDCTLFTTTDEIDSNFLEVVIREV